MVTNREVVFLAVPFMISALASFAFADWKTPREALDQRYVVGPFRIHYTLTDANAFGTRKSEEERQPDATDMIYRLGKQLLSADHYYGVTMGLTPPLENSRFAGTQSIDVHLLAMDGKRGSSGDAEITYRYRHFQPPLPSLTITLSTKWRPPNLTPEHEVFHSYQYGYTFFKNPWFLEGLARSMETAFKKSTFSSEPLPGDTSTLKQFLTRSYAAAPFWNRLRLLCDPSCLSQQGAIRHPATFGQCGGAFVKSLLETFDTLDDKAAITRGIDRENWPEVEQRSSANEPWMLQGLANTMEQQCPIAGNQELTTLHAVIQQEIVR